MKTTPKYKWDSPGEWLLEQIDASWTPEQVQSCARLLAHHVDSDTIQDIFQGDMEDDEYFEPIEEVE